MREGPPGQLPFQWRARTATFGPAYEVDKDGRRICDQFGRIKALMLDGEWRSLREIESALGYPQASISAQLRHMRKPRFGSYVVEKRRRTTGTWEYRVLPQEAP